MKTGQAGARRASVANLMNERLAPDDFHRLKEFIHRVAGITLADRKKLMLEGRLRQRLRATGFESFSDYVDFVFSEEGQQAELVHMIDVVTTNTTHFFRESQHFDILTGRVLPGWKSTGAPFTIWSAGCSTGEEPYTMSMVLDDHALKNPGFDYRVLATDISTRVLGIARMAVYDIEKIAEVPPAFKKRYLLKSKDSRAGLVRIDRPVRERVTFGRLNFVHDAYELPFAPDVAFCRNVIIYFDRQTQEAIMNRIVACIKPGGHLFIGHSETLSGLDVPVEQVAPTVYRKIS